MRVYFSTVVRSAPTDRGGELVALDWERKRPLRSIPVIATNPTLHDPNPRGNTRGGRGIALVGDDVVVCSYHTLRIFDRDLNHRRDVSNGLLVGLHEVCPTPGGTLWVTSTAIDAAFEIDLGTGAILREVWPREMPALQDALGLTPLAIDKSADNRDRFLGEEHAAHPSHVHLNAVARFRDETFALFNKFGAVVSLDRRAVVARDRRLCGGHNLHIDDDGIATVNDSLNQRVFFFDLVHGGAPRILDLQRIPRLRRIKRRHALAERVRRRLHAWRLVAFAPARPLFMRGLDRYRRDLFLGLSPAMIARVDAHTGSLVDLYRHSHDVRACVHGLVVAGP